MVASTANTDEGHSAFVASRERASVSPKRIGIIGAGQIVEDCHLPVLANLGAVEVKWVTDLRVDRLRLLSKMYRVPHIAVQEIAKQIRSVDICLLAIPVGARKEYIEMCAEAEVALYAEKPFARSRAEHMAYMSLFPAHRLAVGFQRRFYRSLGTLKRIIEERVFGDLESIEHSFGQYSLKSGGSERFIVDAELAGGGVLIEAGIHGLDQILFATQADSVKVEAVKAIVYDHLDYDVVVDSTIGCGESEIPVRGEFSRLRNLQQGSVFHFEMATVSLCVSPQEPLRVRKLAQGQVVGYEIRSAGEDDFKATTVNQAIFCLWSVFLRGIDIGQANAASASSSCLTTAWLEAIGRKMVR
jgi:hypothetical protein